MREIGREGRVGGRGAGARGGKVVGLWFVRARAASGCVAMGNGVVFMRMRECVD
jgi:hypothetical protein